MIRAVLLALVVLATAVILLVPLGSTPETFASLLRREQGTVREVLGDKAADRALDRFLAFQEPPAATSPAPRPAVENDAARQMQRRFEAQLGGQAGQFGQQLANSAYVRSLDAMVALAAYRVSALLELVPLLMLFGMACTIDGAVLRQVRSKELVPFDASMVSASFLGMLALAGVAALSLVLPVPLHPLVAFGILVAASFAFSRVIANYASVR